MEQIKILNSLFSSDSLDKISGILNSGKKGLFPLYGLNGSSKNFLIALMATKGIHFIIAKSRDEAQKQISDLEKLVDRESLYWFPTSYNDSIKRDKDSPSNRVQRTVAVEAINKFRKGTHPTERLFLVGYPKSVVEPIIGREKIENSILEISKGDTLSHQFIRELLIENGFEKVDFIVEPGQFAVRGGIIDLFSFSDNRPYRLDFFGDRVEQIKRFDINSQRSIEELERIEIIPDIVVANETVDGREDIFNHFGNDFTIWMDDFHSFINEVDNLSAERFEGLISNITLFQLSTLSQQFDIEDKIEFDTLAQPLFNKNFELLAHDIAKRDSEGYRVFIVSDSALQVERISSILSSIKLERALNFKILPLSIAEGFIDNHSKQCIYSDYQIFDRHRRVATPRSVEKSSRITLNDLNALEVGDYVVHINHGVGRFGGLIKSTIRGKKQEVIRLIYKDGDTLSLSIHGLHKISRYRSKDSTPPKIYRVGSGAWQRLKNNTKNRAKELAVDLIGLYAKRRESVGFAFSPDTYLQQELESSFIYIDTEDQERATEAVKSDMERPYPMDRLICGDVGFGKTEVAIRAAFKAVADNKQVALLVPTTILALQHYKTFSGRLKDFPVKIDYISRLRSAKEIREISKRLKEGEIDIVIGTHRLLSREIAFKDLGLLIIDEEQKFGVAAKERLREFKLNVDTLTLTATPIPRTLQFSLLGARDLSIITTPPPNRLPIQSEVITFDRELLKEAILYEIERGGQIFFVHNVVEEIDSIRTLLGALVPKAKIAVGHGQMEAKRLESTVLDFMMGDYDILLATTIIENGLDIPNANTIIINNAQNFGLSDLHQMRGRVGRSNVKAFCYFIVPSMHSLSDDARKRLKAIESFSELGSGFNIAMQDLDIRGAGNLFGPEQSGFIAEMGFETYRKILEEAIDEVRAEKGLTTTGENDNLQEWERYDNTVVDTDLEVLIPDSYISITSEKIRLYRELDSITKEKELVEFIEGVEDRFGPLPPQTVELTYIVRLRRLAGELGFEKINIKNGLLIAWFINNQDSIYFQSDRFQSILDYLQREESEIRLKEQNEKLYIVVEGISSIEQAYNLFLKL
ncbi:MAG: transcription-repair coupling factor [Bacteroidales bacterium]